MTSLLAAALLAQATPWTPPSTDLPKPFVEAAAFLLSHGMGDPRGGYFREATVETKDRRTGKNMVVVGWVFSDRTPAQVVTTGGVIFPVASVGKEIDLAKFVAGQTAPRITSMFGRNERPGAIFAALLLIDGMPKLAKTQLGAPNEESVGQDVLLDFLRRESEQAKNAFVQGDDALASGFATKVVEQREGFKVEARRLAPRYSISENFDLTTGLTEEIAIDAARRLGHARPPLDLPTLATRPVAERVATLIDRLDETRATGIVFSGWSDPAADPIVQALAKVGDPAVGPLMDCVENDRRLTRIGQITSSDWFTIVSIDPVKETAYRAIEEILKIRNLPKARDMPALRRFWAQNERRTPAERWLRILQDDAAGIDAWRQMAWNLFGYGGFDREVPRPKPLPAESLRGSDRAALSHILDRRTEIASADSGEGNSILSGIEACLTFAEDRARWDPGSALPSLRKATRTAMAPNVPLERLNESFVQAIESRGRLEGEPAWNEYGDWVERTRLTPTSNFQTMAFRPLIKHRGVKSLRKAMRILFASPDSNWTVDRVERNGGWWWIMDFLRSPLLEDNIFRSAVFAALDDRKVIGTATVGTNGDAWFKYDRSSSGDRYPDAVHDPLRPPHREPRPIRVGDQVAMTLAAIKGAPKFRPYWPDKEKDLAITQIKAFVKTKYFDARSCSASPGGSSWKGGAGGRESTKQRP